MRDTILTESVYIQKENVAVSKAVLRVYSSIGQHPLTLNDAILRNADVLDRHFNMHVQHVQSLSLLSLFSKKFSSFC